jgi:hypothetical protein
MEQKIPRVGFLTGPTHEQSEAACEFSTADRNINPAI